MNNYDFFIQKPGIDPSLFHKIQKLRQIQDRDESLTNDDQAKELAYMMRGEELVASASIYICENSALIQRYLVSGIVNGLGVESIFYQNILQSLIYRGVENIYEFAGSPNKNILYELGFQQTQEYFDIDGGYIPVIKYIP
ncbi:Acetyltransferase_(GNAT) domain-containing protein [Hexamita inflata]|uniref:Acetyltransferase_(GNAT) domain-containing protein n=1 Tax=Hexamita inflata TaxID=28002 RepID=A0ABP1HGQ1_9EUKA